MFSSNIYMALLCFLSQVKNCKNIKRQTCATVTPFHIKITLLLKIKLGQGAQFICCLNDFVEKLNFPGKGWYFTSLQPHLVLNANGVKFLWWNQQNSCLHKLYLKSMLIYFKVSCKVKSKYTKQCIYLVPGIKLKVDYPWGFMFYVLKMLWQHFEIFHFKKSNM